MIDKACAPDSNTYEIRVHGHLSETILIAFPDLVARSQDGDTVLTGILPDQSALHGVLSVVEELGLELLEVRREGMSSRS